MRVVEDGHESTIRIQIWAQQGSSRIGLKVWESSKELDVALVEHHTLNHPTRELSSGWMASNAMREAKWRRVVRHVLHRSSDSTLRTLQKDVGRCGITLPQPPLCLFVCLVHGVPVVRVGRRLTKDGTYATRRQADAILLVRRSRRATLFFAEEATGDHRRFCFVCFVCLATLGVPVVA